MGSSESEQVLTLGVNVKDKRSNYQGMVTAICNYLDAPPRVQVTSGNLSEDGTPVTHWFDASQLLPL